MHVPYCHTGMTGKCFGRTSSFKTDAKDDISGSVVIVSIVPTEILYYIGSLQSRTTVHFPGASVPDLEI